MHRSESNIHGESGAYKNHSTHTKKTITTTWLVIIFILLETDMGPR